MTGPAPATVSGFAEVTLEVRDRQAMERFYREVDGLTTLAEEDDRTWLAAGEHARLGLWLPGEKEFGDEGGSHVHYAYSATPDQLDALAARLAQRDVEHRGPVGHEGGDRSLYFEDPEGNVVEVWDIFGRGRDVASLAQVRD